MEKTLEQFLEEIKNSEELKEQLADILQNENRETLEKWMKEQGCGASVNEAKEFLVEKKKELEKSGELTPEQLEQAAGGSVAGGIAVALAATAALAFAIDGFISLFYGSSGSC